MCGRFILTLEASQLEQEFGIKEVPDGYQPRFNVAPTQSIATVIDAEERKIEMLRWGLIPSWAKDPSIGSRMINARSETAADKPAFRQAFQKRRCLILADGFFEWQRPPGKRSPAIPYVFRRKENKPFAFAGLWEAWKPEEGDWMRTCTILTCSANELVSSVHDRMPVILTGDTAWKWMLSPSRSELEALLAPYPGEDMLAYPVSTLVNKPDQDHPDLIRPVA